VQPEYNPYEPLTIESELQSEVPPISPAIRIVQYAAVSTICSVVSVATFAYDQDHTAASIISALAATGAALMAGMTALEYTVINTNLLAQGKIDRTAQCRVNF
jgi:hypothetical protein